MRCCCIAKVDEVEILFSISCGVHMYLWPDRRIIANVVYIRVYIYILGCKTVVKKFISQNPEEDFSLKRYIHIILCGNEYSYYNLFTNELRH